MKRPESSPADKLRQKKAAKKINTIFGNYHKRRIGIEGVERKILEIDGVDWVRMELSYTDLGGYRQLAKDHGYYSPKVTCGSDTTDGTAIEFWHTDGEEFD